MAFSYGSNASYITIGVAWKYHQFVINSIVYATILSYVFVLLWLRRRGDSQRKKS